jgi:hypothetical protein
MDTVILPEVDEIMESTEEIGKNSFGESLMTAAGIGAVVVLAGFVAYKYVAKPIIAKVKAKKNEEKITEAIPEPETDGEQVAV